MSSEQPPASPLQPAPLLVAAPQSQQLPPISTPHLSTPQPTSTASHRSPTPLDIQLVNPGTPETNRKRARPTVSCFECRRKKLKCDRVQPCGQCVKGHRESLCQFATAVTKVGVSRARPQPGDAARVEDGSERAGKRMRVEEILAPSLPFRNGGTEETDKTDQRASGSTLGRIYIKGSRSRYLGIGDRMAMLDHFEDARAYVMRSFKDPDTTAMMQELTTYQKSFQRKPKKSQIQVPQDRPSLVTEMLRSLMTKKFSSAYYFYESHWEGFTRVLHTQTFIKEAEEVEEFLKTQFSNGNYSLPSSIRESIIPQMVSVLALSARLNNLNSKEDPEDQISIWAEMIQRWLDGLKGKERLNIQTLRTQILFLLMKMNNLSQTSDLWKESGTLVRSAMIMGLHQDPESYEDISLFEKEQRRKLWRTIVELDIQFSLTSGMPAGIRSSDFNFRQLRNVDDSALREDMVTYPEDKADRLWTDASPQVILGASIKERLDATNMLAGNVNLLDDTQKLLCLARYLEHSMQGLPTPSRVEEPWGQVNERSPGRLFTKIMLDVQLRRPALCIYQHIMLSEEGGRYPEARKGAVRSAVVMLSHLDALDPEVADPNTIKNRDELNLFHVLCKKDIIQAALILCLEIRSFTLTSRGEGRPNGVQVLQNDILPWTKISLTRIVENTLNSLLQRLGEFGSDLKDIFPLSIVLQSARSDGSPEDKRVLMKKGSERILKACRDALPNIPHTPASPGSFQDPSSNIDPNQLTPNIPQPYNSNQYQALDQFNTDPKNGFADFSLLQGSDLAFQDFDFGFDDWGMSGSWL